MSLYLAYTADCDVCGRILESGDGQVIGSRVNVLEMAEMCGWKIFVSGPDMPAMFCSPCSAAPEAK